MKYKKEQLEKFLQENFEITNKIDENFGGKHGFTSKTCFQSGKFEVVLWENDEKFYIIAGGKGKLHKVFFSNKNVVEVYEEERLEEIFLHAKLNENLKINSKNNNNKLKI